MNKKTFIAVLAILGLIFSSFAVQLGDVAKAVSYAGPTKIEPPVDSMPPLVTALSPGNGTLFSSANIISELSVKEPEPEPDGFSLKWIHVVYVPDWQNKIYVTFNGNYNSSLGSLNSSFTMANVPDGNHSATVTVTATFNKITGRLTSDYYELVCSSLIYFEVDTVPPCITNLNVENRLNQEGVALNFDINESAAWIGYSLDKAVNETVSGNFTLNNLSEGVTHSLVIFANDTFGNMGKSETVQLAFFRIATPTPSPTLEPSPTTKANFYSDWIPYAIVAVIIVSIGASAVYVKKRKREL